MARLATTAYIAWAVLRRYSGKSDDRRHAGSTCSPIQPDDTRRPLRPGPGQQRPAGPRPTGRVGARRTSIAWKGLKTSEDGKSCLLEAAGASGRTAFYGAGRSGHVETTALAALALHRRRSSRSDRGPAPSAWLVKQQGRGRHLALDAGDGAGAQGPARRHRLRRRRRQRTQAHA